MYARIHHHLRHSISLTVLSVGWIVANAGFAQEPVLQTAPERTVQPLPILIEADHFEVRFDEDIAVWQGQVSATRGNYTFRTSNLKIHLDQVNQNAPQTTQTTGGQSQPVADHFYLSAESLTYDLASDAITGSGDSELRRGQELIRAETITYWVGKQLAVAKPDLSGRVSVQFFPNPKRPIFPGQNTLDLATSSNQRRVVLAAQ